MGINPLLSKHIKTLEEKDMLTSILEKNKVALIHGESGSGKTVFAIKHLPGGWRAAKMAASPVFIMLPLVA